MRQRRRHRQPRPHVAKSTFYSVGALNRGLAETNPVIGTEKNEEQSRERVLAPSELRLDVERSR